VWLALQQVGREGYVQMISDDIRLSRAMFDRIGHYPELEALTQGLSITTFRYVPSDLKRDDAKVGDYLNDLNRELLTRLQQGGEVYLSNAVVGGKYALRACIVNFRTTLEDVEALLPIIVRIGDEVDKAFRPSIVA
jgi:glutamate/tyrosine decarboxylase-like PLP-dependent enzyme